MQRHGKTKCCIGIQQRLCTLHMYAFVGICFPSRMQHLDSGMVLSQVGDAKTWEDNVLHRDSTKTVHFAHVCFRGHLFSEQDATP